MAQVATLAALQLPMLLLAAAMLRAVSAKPLQSSEVSYYQRVLPEIAAATTAAAAVAACPAQPVTLNPAMLNSREGTSGSYTTCRVLIIGGGAGGRFSAYMLRELGREVCAVERQKAWGGKLQNAGPFIGPDGSSSKDVEDAAHAAVGLAAMWVHGSQKSIRCLANQLNVTLETNSDDQLVHSRGQWVRGSVDNLATTQNGTYAKPAFDLEAAVDDEEELGLASLLWNCILGVSATDPLTGKSPSPHPSTACANYTKVRDYIVDAVGQEAYDFMLADTPEPFNYELPLDVCLWIDAELSLGRSMDTDLQLIPRGGWHKIVDKARAAAAAAGVRFFAGSGIDCISSVRAAERPAVYASASRQDAAAGGAGIIDDSTDAEDAFGGDGADATGGVHAPGDTEDDDAGADAADLNITDQPIVPIISDANVTAPAYQYNHLASGSKAGRVLVAERVIFASGPQDVRNLLGDVGMKLAQSHEVASIRGIEVVVYNAFYPNRWWEQYGAVKYANLPIRHVDDTCLVFSEFVGHPYHQLANGTRPVYAADIECVAFYRNLSASGGVPAVRQHVQTSLQRVIPRADVPEPYFDAYKYHSDGWHSFDVGATQRNVTIRSVLDWSLAPLGPGTHLCMVGEAWDGNHHGWTVGAWDTAWRCVAQNHKDLLTPQALAAAVYINSGCNGAAEFANEVQVPTDVALPGFNPATGKPMLA